MSEFIKGMDVSTLIEQEACGARYFDHGKEGDALQILKSYGTNYVRLRLWNDPYAEDGSPYGAGTNDLEKTVTLAKRAKALDMGVLLDLHYSDFWADPGKQNLPKAWRGYTPEQLEQAVEDYTREVMEVLHRENAAPTMVQVGNEITNGLLWPTGRKPWKNEDSEGGDPEGYTNIARYVSAGIRGVKAVDPKVPIMIHLDNGGLNSMYVDWFDHYVEQGEDFDIIGLSYYPFWHGKLEELSFNMQDMARRYGKKICVAEVSMGFTMEDYRKYEVPSDIRESLKEACKVRLETEAGKMKDRKGALEVLHEETLEDWGRSNRMGMATRPELVAKLPYPMTKEGQADFMLDVMRRVKEVPGGMGFFYWEPAWTPVPGCGWATKEALAYTGEKGKEGNEWANQALFDYEGNTLPALDEIRDFQ